MRSPGTGVLVAYVLLGGCTCNDIFFVPRVLVMLEHEDWAEGVWAFSVDDVVCEVILPTQETAIECMGEEYSGTLVLGADGPVEVEVSGIFPDEEALLVVAQNGDVVLETAVPLDFESIHEDRCGAESVAQVTVEVPAS